MMDTLQQLRLAKEAKSTLASADAEVKNALLFSMASALEQKKEEILSANRADLAAAAGHISPVMLDRLRLDEERVGAMAAGVRAVAALSDPVGEVMETLRPQNGLHIEKRRVPFGVVAVIYESRPNVTADAAALCIKSGNACVLRGGKEAAHSNFAIAAALKSGAEACGFPPEIVTFIADTGREGAAQLMNARGFVDLLIPRGGAGLIRACVENATVPVIETGTGICHLYVDKAAKLDMAARILYNGKVQRPSVCNALEVCIVHADVAADFLPLMEQTLGGKCELHLSAGAARYIKGVPALPADFDTEFLDYKLAVCVVNSLEEAIHHIALHSTGHSECIVTEDAEAAKRFLAEVDSAAVYHNASTRFTDGGEFGFGCEVGISTQKLGARGPTGLRELTSYKYVIEGSGQVR